MAGERRISEATVERTVAFHARHHYHHPDWSEAENERAFGPLVRSHGHDYRISVAVRGPMDAVTGFVVDLPELDRAIEAVVAPLRGADLNAVIPEVDEGVWLPSCENLSRWVWDALAPLIGGEARLVRVRVSESPDLAAEYAPSDLP